VEKNIREEVRGHLIKNKGTVEEDVGRDRLNSYDNKNPFGLKYAVQFVTQTPLPLRDWHNADPSEMDLCAGQVVKAREVWVKSETDMRTNNQRNSSG
jgi:hypothetical protein